MPDGPATLLAPGERTPGNPVLAVLGHSAIAIAAVWGVAAEWLRRVPSCLARMTIFGRERPE